MKIGSTISSDCVNCPAGKIRGFVGGSSINDCIDCPSGYYSNEGEDKCEIVYQVCTIIIMVIMVALTALLENIVIIQNQITCDVCPENSESNVDFTGCECIKRNLHGFFKSISL